MATRLYLATGDGLTIAEQHKDSWTVKSHALAGQSATSVIAHEQTILVGTTDGVYKSIDEGQTWQTANQNLTIRRVRWLARPHKGFSFVLAGTEPAAIFVSYDEGDTWIGCPEVEELRDAHGWHLPYSPRAGCVRGFAIHGNERRYQALAYAAVEVGGLLRSTDGGETWELVEGSDGNPDRYRPYGTMIHPDVHSISLHPQYPNLLIAPTGGGLYQSTDSGINWTQLYACYCRAAWVNPQDPNHIVFGPADGVSENGRIETSTDGGKTWHLTSQGMDAPWANHMVERFVEMDDALLALLSNGQLWSARPGEDQWVPILSQVPDIRSATPAT